MDLDADVRTYLPGPGALEGNGHRAQPDEQHQRHSRPVGAFRLRGIHYTDTITMRDFEQTLRPQQTLNFQPGSRFLYSNSNFTMIAQIVHRISGMDLPDFAQQHIFTPLGMTHTCIRRGYWQMIPELALSYSDDGSGRFVPSALNFAAVGSHLDEYQRFRPDASA